MCGRYTLTVPVDVVVELFGIQEPLEEAVAVMPRRYNIAPTQDAPVVRHDRDGRRRLHLLRWGLVPHWAEDPAVGHRMINARAESAADRPAFRDAFRRHRCLVPADGFYEWTREPDGRQPWWIRPPDGRPFAFAGLWSRWGPRERRLDTFTILTRTAAPSIRQLHDRMPVIVDPADYDLWLDPEVDDPVRLAAVLGRPTGDVLSGRRVSRSVNSPAHDTAEVLTPPGELPGEGAQLANVLAERGETP